MSQERERNPAWKGGRTIASNGYVLVKVGVQHHLADVRGYAYEHRVVVEQKIGRRLTSGEQVHHIDGNKKNNHPTNLMPVQDTAHHRLLERKQSSRLRHPDEENYEIHCGCGCSTPLMKYDNEGRPRAFISGHNPRRIDIGTGRILPSVKN